MPKFRVKVPHLRRDSRTSFKVKRSKIKVTRPINADTHRAPYLSNGMVYELQTWYTDGGRRPASATCAMTSNVNSHGYKVTRSVWAVLCQCCTCVIRSRRGHTVSAEPGGHAACCITLYSSYWLTEDALVAATTCEFQYELHSRSPAAPFGLRMKLHRLSLQPEIIWTGWILPNIVPLLCRNY